MTKDQVRAVLERVPTWPEDRQQELAELALEIEAELAGASYEATPEELTAIHKGLTRRSCQRGGSRGGLHPLGVLRVKTQTGCVYSGYDPLANSVVSNRTSIPGVCFPSVSSGTRFIR
jgi:hypothetical protein